MLRRKLAEKLISAKSESQRKRLFAENENLADESLALALKEICYELWTTEPTRTQKASQALKTLLQIKPTGEIRAFYFWVEGISELTKGKLESAVKNLDKSAAIFEKIKPGRCSRAAWWSTSLFEEVAAQGPRDERWQL